MWEKIKNIFRRKQALGLHPLPADERDFDVGIFGWGEEYLPKHEEWDIPNLSVKNQGRKNICGWASKTGAKEIDEKCFLEMRGLVMIGKKNNLISGNGYSNLRDNELMVQKFGIPELGQLPAGDDLSWEDYSNVNLLTDSILANAKTHRSGSFWRITSKNQFLKALDDGRPVRFGMKWFTGYNIISAPYLLEYGKGSFVGGHAVYGRGYKKINDFLSVKIQNSFGKDYGENGCMYMKIDDVIKDASLYGAYVDMDLEKDTSAFLNDHDGDVIKNSFDNKCFLLLHGKKQYFPDEATMMSWGIDTTKIITDTDGILADIESGPQLSFWDGKNVLIIKQLIQSREDLKPLFKGYFNEFFSN